MRNHPREILGIIGYALLNQRIRLPDDITKTDALVIGMCARRCSLPSTRLNIEAHALVRSFDDTEWTVGKARHKMVVWRRAFFGNEMVNKYEDSRKKTVR